MATKIVTVVVGQGKEIAVEVDDDVPEVGVKSVGLGKDGRINLSAALDNIKDAAEQLRETLAKIAVPPQNCEISFGIKLSASAGVILAKAGTEANFTIKMGWTQK